MSDNSGAAQKELHIHEIGVHCKAKDTDLSELKDLKLVIVKAQGNVPIELTRVSGTEWKQRDQGSIPVPSMGLVLVATSERHGDLGFGFMEEDLTEGLRGQGDLRRNLKLEGGNGYALSVSFAFYKPVSKEGRSQSLLEQMLANPSMALNLFSLLPDDDPSKAIGLYAIGGEFREKFANTQDGADIDASINAYEQALALLSADDIRVLVFLQDTGIAYRDRFHRFGKVEDIDMAIERLQISLEMLPKGDEILPAVLNNLGSCFAERFDHTGNMDDLTQSIQLKQRAVDLTPEGHSDLPSRLNNLGNSFLRQFERTGDIHGIGQSIQLQQRAVELTPEGHADLPSRLNNLGTSFTCRFERTGDLHDIGQSIELEQRAVELTPEGHADLPSLLNNLGSSFRHRFDRTGNLHDIGKSIQLQERAVELTPEGHADLPSWLNNLGTSFTRRFERTGDLHDIGQSIELKQRAVELTPEGHADLPSHLNNLGNSFARRFERTGDLHDIGKSIQLQERAVELTPEGHADLPSRLNNLGTSFTHRFERTGDLRDIGQSIQLQQRAVELTPEGHADLSSRLNNLGTSFTRRFERTGDLHDIGESIELQQRAVGFTPKGHADLPSLLNNLGSSFLHRFERTGNLHDIGQSIEYNQKAVQLTPESHTDLPSWLHNLGVSFMCRFERTGNLHDIGESIRLQQRAVELTPEGHTGLPGLHHNLGSAFLARFRSTQSSEDILVAYSSYRISAMSITGPPSVCLKSARNWALLSFIHSQSETLAAHERVVELISIIAGMENTSRRRHELLKELSQDSTKAAAAALSVNHPSKALEWLEAGRCVVWNQINQLRSPVDELRAYHPGLADRFMLLSKQLEQLGNRADPRQGGVELPMQVQVSLELEANNHLKLAKEREQLLDTIREIPCFNSFLRPRRRADLMKAVPDNGVVVIINSDNTRCDAIILLAGQIEPVHIPLDKFSRDRAQTLADGLRFRLDPHEFRSRYVGDMAYPRKIGRYKGPSPGDDVKGMLRALWDDLVDPVLQFLGFKNEREDTDLPRIWWCPTGPFAFLPIHAAGIYDPDGGSSSACLADYAVSSYIPTLSILGKLRSRSSDGAIDGTVLFVSQPDTPGQSSIPNTRPEIIKAREELEKRGIKTAWYNGEDATVASVSESMRSFSSVHLACHASQNITNPLESAIFLHEGALELSEIIKMDLPKADLAFLSACQTSVGARNLPEEAVHLAGGMLTAGYRSVVATMWSISDYHAPDVAETFYKCLMNDEAKEGVVRLDITGSAQALHIAVQALRRKLGDSTEDLLKWIPYVHYGI